MSPTNYGAAPLAWAIIRPNGRARPVTPLPGIVEPEAALFIGGPIPVRSILKRSASFNRPAGLAFMPARRWLVFLPLVRLRAGPIQPV
jgi:hypothetical protein